MNDVIAAEVWEFFCKQLPRKAETVQKQKVMYSEMEWAAQTEELNTKLVRSTVSRADETEVLIRIPLMTQIFELTIRKSDSFPEESPDFNVDFINGFRTFEWNPDSTLYELTEKITDYCTAVDIAILEIKEADTDGFQVIELEVDEEENGHLIVQMKAIKYSEKLVLSLDIEDFRSFPRVLRCSNPSRTASFDCERWISDDKLALNLRRLYGELELNSVSNVAVENEMQSGNDSFEEDVEIMDFI